MGVGGFPGNGFYTGLVSDYMNVTSTTAPHSDWLLYRDGGYPPVKVAEMNGGVAYWRAPEGNYVEGAAYCSNDSNHEVDAKMRDHLPLRRVIGMSLRRIVLVASIALASVIAAVATATAVRSNHVSVVPDQGNPYAAPTPRDTADVSNPPAPGQPGLLPAVVASDPFIRSQQLKDVRSTRIGGIYTATASNGDTCLIVDGAASFGAGCSPAAANGGVVTLGTGLDYDTNKPLTGGNERLYGVVAGGLTTATVGSASTPIDGDVFVLDVKPGNVVTISGGGKSVRRQISARPILPRPPTP